MSCKNCVGTKDTTSKGKQNKTGKKAINNLKAMMSKKNK